MTEPARTRIHSAQEYQAAFMEALDTFAKNHRLQNPYVERTLSDPEVKNMLEAAAEDVRKLYGLTDAEHLMYKDMVMLSYYGKNRGRS